MICTESFFRCLLIDDVECLISLENPCHLLLNPGKLLSCHKNLKSMIGNKYAKTFNGTNVCISSSFIANVLLTH